MLTRTLPTLPSRPITMLLVLHVLWCRQIQANFDYYEAGEQNAACLYPAVPWELRLEGPLVYSELRQNV